MLYKYTNYNKVIIIDKNGRSFDNYKLLQYFNKIIEVNDIYDKKKI